jgi:hypothetical protein
VSETAVRETEAQQKRVAELQGEDGWPRLYTRRSAAGKPRPRTRAARRWQRPGAHRAADRRGERPNPAALARAPTTTERRQQ